MSMTEKETTTGGKLVHESTYNRKHPRALVHRARLRAIMKVLTRYVPASARTWADFGCSNGFIIEQVLAAGGFQFDRIVGYDNQQDLLDLALQKQLPNTTFEVFDMNSVDTPRARFELVTCFETLEHVGDYKAGFENVFNHVADGGVLVTTVPNETGLPGIVKLAARGAISPSTDREFLRACGTGNYVRRLLANGYVDEFRDPTKLGYGSHLGFDYRRLYEFVDREFVADGRLELVAHINTTMHFNKVAVYRRR